MTANHPVKPTITSRPGILEQISVVPWEIALVILLITFILLFPNQVSSEMQPSTGMQPSSAADEYDVTRNICIKDESLDKGIPLTDPHSQGPPISLGCKLRDCGPPSPIEMRILLKGNDVVDSMRIEFTNLPSAIKSLIKEATGAPVFGRDGNIHIPRGQQLRLQIPEVLIADGTSVRKNLTIQVTLQLNKPLLEKHRGSPEFNQLQRHNWNAQLEIYQLKKQVVVNEFKAHYAIRWCLSPLQPPPESHSFDQIELLAAKGKIKETTLMISGHSQSTGSERQSECLKYTPLQGTNSLLVGNMLAKSTDCQLNEIVIFSKDRAMQIYTPDPNWTDAGNELRKIILPDKPVQIPVTFWILHKPKPLSTLKEALLGQLERANQLFGPDNECGIKFVATKDSFHDEADDAESEGLSDATQFCGGSGVDSRTITKFENKNWKDSSAINVYYVSKPIPDRARGTKCGFGIFLSDNPPSDLETLAHELGHELGLQHPSLENIDRSAIGDPTQWRSSQKNLMFSGGIDRSELTKGQCFRCYMNASSKIRTLVDKAEDQWGKSRDCGDPQNNCIDIGETVTNPP